MFIDSIFTLGQYLQIAMCGYGHESTDPAIVHGDMVVEWPDYDRMIVDKYLQVNKSLPLPYESVFNSVCRIAVRRGDLRMVIFACENYPHAIHIACTSSASHGQYEIFVRAYKKWKDGEMEDNPTDIAIVALRNKHSSIAKWIYENDREDIDIQRLAKCAIITKNYDMLQRIVGDKDIAWREIYSMLNRQQSRDVLQWLKRKCSKLE